MHRSAQRMSCALLAAVSLAGGAACGGGGDGDGGGGGQTSSFVGIVSSDDGTATGSIAVTIQATALAPPAATGPNLRDPVNATGTFSLGGDTPMTGTYDPDTDILALTGGGYTLGGGFDGVDRLEGIWTGPGATSGTFVAIEGSSGVAYCGTYIADDLSDSGSFSFAITGGVVRGEAYSSTDQIPIPLDGVISGNAITIYVPGSTTVVLASGTRSGNNVSGTYDNGSGDTGTWTGSVCP